MTGRRRLAGCRWWRWVKRSKKEQSNEETLRAQSSEEKIRGIGKEKTARWPPEFGAGGEEFNYSSQPLCRLKSNQLLDTRQSSGDENESS